MKGYKTRTFEGIPLGLYVQRSICHTWTYRIRRGNGSYDTKVGELIQDKYPYFVPRSICNPESEPYRRQWIAAVAAWQALTPATKKWWNEEAQRLRLVMSGYNLFIRKAMKGEIGMFVDRGDFAVPDYDKDDLTIDAAWHDLDLSSIVPAGAKAVLTSILCKTAVLAPYALMRTKGNVGGGNINQVRPPITDVLYNEEWVVICDVNRKVQYRLQDIVWTTFNIYIKGWWT